jgi:hypothetical protein
MDSLGAVLSVAALAEGIAAIEEHPDDRSAGRHGAVRR